MNVTTISKSKKRHAIARATFKVMPVGICLAALTVLGAEGPVGPASQPVAQATSRPAVTHGITTAPGGGLMINFNQAPIDNVLDELSSVAGFIIVPVAKPTGRITLISKQPVTPKDAISLLNTVMRDAGFAAIQQGRIIKIVSITDAMTSNHPVRTVTDPEQLEPTDELITAVIPLKQADAKQLQQDLAPLVNPSASFAANESSNALIVTDTQANIRRIVEIVSSLDKSLVNSAEVKVFQLQFASATSAAQLIDELFGQAGSQRSTGNTGGGGNPFSRFFGGGGGGGGFGGFGGFGGGGGGGGRGGQGGGGGGGQQRSGQDQGGRDNVPVKASADDRTNTVVVSGPPDTLEEIGRILHELDANPAAQETVFVYKLKNAQALNVQAVLNNLFNGTPGSSSSSGTRSNVSSNNISGGTRAFGSSSGIGGSSGSSGFGGSSRGGSSGGFGSSSGLGGSSGGFGSSSSNRGGSTSGFGGSSGGFGGGGGGLSQGAGGFADQVNIIADADTNSILIRTKPTNYDQVKAVLDSLDRAIGQVLIKVLIAEVTHDNSKDLGAEWSVLNLSSGGNGEQLGTTFSLPTSASPGAGLLAKIVSGDVQATIHVLESTNKIDVLSRPYILATDNQLAEIVVGQEVPFITSSQTTDAGQTNNQIQYGDVGVLVDVIPHINSEGVVTLDVAPEISALTTTTVPIASNIFAPVFDRRSAQSRVVVKDGQTVVIGGLMEDRKTSHIDKVPILGDLPFVGQAFKHTQDEKTKTELLIFLTPHVALEPGMLKDMSDSEIRGSKLVPQAVYPGAFEEHKAGLERGGYPATQPSDGNSQ